MELRIEKAEIPEKISFNYDELKRELAEKIENYNVAFYSDIKQAKTDRATLNKLKKALNDERIRLEKEYMKPFNEFKKEISDLIGLINEPLTLIDGQIKEQDEERKEAKKAEILELFNTIEKPDFLTLEQIFNPKWLNVTTKLNAIEEEIKSRIEAIQQDLEIIQRLPKNQLDVAFGTYLRTLSLSDSVKEAERIAEIKNKRQQEAEKPEEEPEGKWIAFEANVTVEQAMQMKRVLSDLGIKIRPLNK